MTPAMPPLPTTSSARRARATLAWLIASLLVVACSTSSEDPRHPSAEQSSIAPTSPLSVTATQATPPAPPVPRVLSAPPTQLIETVEVEPVALEPVGVEAELEEPTLRFVVIADLNSSYGATYYSPDVRAAIARIIELKPDLVLSAGDMIAGERHGLDYAGMWSAFHRTVSDPLTAAALPLAVSPGNHDASARPAFRTERQTYTREWTRRRPDLDFVDDAEYPLRYAFTQGPALFIALDTTRRGDMPAEQRAWLEGVLSEHGPRHALRIVYGHVPLYPFARGTHRERVLNDALLEALLVDQGVDLYITGHHHAYFPARRGPLRLVSAGSLGTLPRKLIGADERQAKSFLLVELSETRVLSIEALAAPDFTTPIARETLPEVVGEGPQSMRRDDLEEETR